MITRYFYPPIPACRQAHLPPQGGKGFYPPTQKTAAVKPGMNALDGPSEALPSSLPAGRQGQSEGGFSLLRRIPPKGLRYRGC